MMLHMSKNIDIEHEFVTFKEMNLQYVCYTFFNRYIPYSTNKLPGHLKIEIGMGHLIEPNVV